MDKKVGDALNIRWAADGKNDDTDLVVKATLRDASDAQVGDILVLTHTGDGVFKDDTALMPDTAKLTVRVIPYLGDATTLNDSYLSSLQTYERWVLPAEIKRALFDRVQMKVQDNNVKMILKDIP